MYLATCGAHACLLLASRQCFWKPHTGSYSTRDLVVDEIEVVRPQLATTIITAQFDIDIQHANLTRTSLSDMENVDDVREYSCCRDPSLRLLLPSCKVIMLIMLYFTIHTIFYMFTSSPHVILQSRPSPTSPIHPWQ